MILFDHNFNYKLADALNLLEHGCKSKDNTIIQVNHIDHLTQGRQGVTDEEVIEIAGKNKATIITYDRDFKRIKNMYPLYEKHNVGVIYFKSSKDVSSRGYWGMITTIIIYWFDVREIVRDNKAPYCFIMGKNGVSRQSF